MALAVRFVEGIGKFLIHYPSYILYAALAGRIEYYLYPYIAVNVLSPQGRIKTPGNIFAQNDKENPDLNFEEAVAMGKAAVWICEQDPQQFTGNILFDEDLCREKGL